MNELNGTIHGIVSEEGVAKVDNEVVLLDHETLSILARTRTDKFGGYMFNNLDPDKTDYMMYTVDNDGAQPKNALIKDYVQPVKGNNGSVAGNFLAVLDALAPVQSCVPVKRPDGTGQLVRAHGGMCPVGVDALQPDKTSELNVDTAGPDDEAHCPVPSAPQIRAMKGEGAVATWRTRFTSPVFFTDANPREEVAPYLKDERGIGYSTVLILHRATDGQPTSYRVCGEEGVETHNWGYSEWWAAARALADVTGATVARQRLMGFHVCVEANRQLRLKWLDRLDGEAPDASGLRNELVTTLPKDKWVAILFRAGAPTEKSVVEVLDVYAGTTTKHEVRATGHIFTGKSVYNERYGPAARNGFGILGEYNETAATINGYPPAAPATFTAGPWARWNRKLSDAEAKLLLASIYDTTLSKVPRFVAEIYKHAPTMVVPMDEFPTAQPPLPTRRGLRVPVFYVGQQARPVPYLSGRRRMVNKQPKGFSLVFAPDFYKLTLLACVYQTVAGGEGTIVSYGGATSDSSLYPSYPTVTALELAVNAFGEVELRYRLGGAGIPENNALEVRKSRATAVKSVGYHMVAAELDLRVSYTAKIYVDGALVATERTTQGYLQAYGFPSTSSVPALSALMVVGNNAARRVSSYNDTQTLGVERLGSSLGSPLVVTDMATYAGCIGADAIKEIYDAWQIAIGDDSHA